MPLPQRIESDFFLLFVFHFVSSLCPPINSNLSEREIFQLIGDGLSHRQIADRLRLRVNTVETYRARTKQKLGLKGALELLQSAIRASRERSLKSCGGFRPR
jgi:DNA-binding CsgD family transcriptional regulator